MEAMCSMREMGQNEEHMDTEDIVRGHVCDNLGDMPAVRVKGTADSV